eukprot:4388275-Pyramimonas_sp.AAC.1
MDVPRTLGSTWSLIAAAITGYISPCQSQGGREHILVIIARAPQADTVRADQVEYTVGNRGH